MICNPHKTSTFLDGGIEEPNDGYKVYEEETMKGNFEHLLERHECDRVCKKGEPPKTCQYELHISSYTTMGKVTNKLIPISFISMLKCFKGQNIKKRFE